MNPRARDSLSQTTHPPITIQGDVIHRGDGGSPSLSHLSHNTPPTLSHWSLSISYNNPPSLPRLTFIMARRRNESVIMCFQTKWVPTRASFACPCTMTTRMSCPTEPSAATSASICLVFTSGCSPSTTVACHGKSGPAPIADSRVTC